MKFTKKIKERLTAQSSALGKQAIKRMGIEKTQKQLLDSEKIKIEIEEKQLKIFIKLEKMVREIHKAVVKK